MATFDGNAETALIFSQAGGNPFPVLIAGYTHNGSSGADQLYGGDYAEQTRFNGPQPITDIVLGRDHLNGGGGNDYIDGRGGNDSLSGGDGFDTVIGGFGNDSVHGNAGNDVGSGGDGNDTVHGGADDDIVSGDGGDDAVLGDNGNDGVYGNAGVDQVYGGGGNDTVRGGMDNDQVYGDDGNDFVAGDVGVDVMTGGSGADTFYFALGLGADTITDFNRGDGDSVQIGSGAYSLSQVGANTVVTMSDGATLTLLNVTYSSLDSGWIS